MTTRMLQRSFAGGELAPDMFARVDDPVYHAGAETMTNFLPSVQGAARLRPGFEFIAMAGGASRLIPFEKARDDTMVVELGPGFLRFIVAGEQLQVADLPTPTPWVEGFSVLAVGAGFLEIDYSLAPVFRVGDPVQLVYASGTLPGPLVADTTYYVESCELNGTSTRYEVTLAYYPGGSAISWSTTTLGAWLVRVHVVGDMVSRSGVDYYCLQNHRVDETGLDEPGSGTDWTEYWTPMAASGPFELPTRYTAAELFEIGYVQSADVITLVHKNHPPQELRRYGNSALGLTQIEFTAPLPPPSVVTATPDYGLVMQLNGLKRQAPDGTSLGTVAKLNTQAPHNLAEGDTVYVKDNTGGSLASVGLSEGYFRVGETLRDSGAPGRDNDFGLLDVDTGAWITATGDLTWGAGPYGTVRYAPVGEEADHTYVVTAVSSDGIESVASAPVTVTDNVLFVSGAKNIITWSAVANAVRYHVYRKQSGAYGYLGKAEAGATLVFEDYDLDVDLSITPPIEDTSLTERALAGTCDLADTIVFTEDHGMVEGSPMRFRSIPSGSALVAETVYFAVNVTARTTQVAATRGGSAMVLVVGGPIQMLTGDFPGAVCYFEGRRVFGSTTKYPHAFWATRSNTESDLRYSLPVKADDRVALRVASRKASPIEHIVPLDRLLLLTSSAEYVVLPEGGGPLAPDTKTIHPQSYVGASPVRPVVMDSAVIFAEARGGRVRAFRYRADADGFVPEDLTLRASHMFEGHTIVDVAITQAPRTFVWWVSSSGALLVLSFNPAHNTVAWSRVVDAVGRVESVAAVAEGNDDRLYVVMNRDGTRTIERLGEQSTSAAELVYLDGAVVGSTATVTGLDHLEGQTVTALIDAETVEVGHVVVGGEVTVSTTPSASVVVGLPYESTLKPMPLVAADAGAGALGQTINVDAAWLRVIDSPPFLVGPPGDTTMSDYEASGTERSSGMVSVGPLPPDWAVGGQIVIQHVVPLPLVIVGLVLEVSIGG